jgi:GrpB-like predicted nucleotidyltransferase (UPF0157 family)
MPASIKVELVPHSAEWAAKAREESKRISAALGLNLVAIHHIGSTAIPSICAKPILDLMPEVQSLDSLDAARNTVQELGYEWWGEYGIRGRRYCTLNEAVTGRRLVQLHFFQGGDPEIERHLAFRDYLRSHPDTALAYDKEKRRCRDLYPDNSYSYTDAKAAWISAVLSLALDYYRSEIQS